MRLTGAALARPGGAGLGEGRGNKTVGEKIVATRSCARGSLSSRVVPHFGSAPHMDAARLRGAESAAGGVADYRNV